MATGAECVTDGGGAYGNNENCIIRVLDTVHVTATQYEVETCCDYLTIGGTRYRGSTNAPTNVLMPAGSTMRWHTDFSVTSGGFTICATSAVANPPPPPAPHPPSGCNEGLWPGVYSPGGTCDTCKVLVQGLRTVYGSCDGYCRAIHRTCVHAWQNDGNTCNEQFQMACVTHPDPSQDDLGICECSEQLLTPAWTITASVPDGACELSNDGACATDGAGSYGNNNRCTFTANFPLYATATEYSVESNYDYLTIHGTRYHASTGAPLNIFMSVGETVGWYTDGSVVRGGFTLCAVPAHIPPELSTSIRHTYYVPPQYYPFLKKLGHDSKCGSKKPQIS